MPPQLRAAPSPPCSLKTTGSRQQSSTSPPTPLHGGLNVKERSGQGQPRAPEPDHRFCKGLGGEGWPRAWRQEKREMMLALAYGMKVGWAHEGQGGSGDGEEAVAGHDGGEEEGDCEGGGGSTVEGEDT